MNVAVYKELAQRFGVRAFAQSAALAAVGKVTEMQVFAVYLLEVGVGTEVPSGVEIRIVTAQDFERYVDEPGLELPRSLLREAIPNGDICVGAFTDGVLAAYAWYATKPAQFESGLTAECAPSYAYAYKNFTRPAARGRSLQKWIKKAALAHYLRVGKRGIVAAVDMANHISRRSLEGAGARQVGYFVCWRVAGRVLSAGTPGSRRVGFRQYGTVAM